MHNVLRCKTNSHNVHVCGNQRVFLCSISLETIRSGKVPTFLKIGINDIGYVDIHNTRRYEPLLEGVLSVIFLKRMCVH